MDPFWHRELPPVWRVMLGPRRKHPAWAWAHGALLLLTITAILLVIASDGRPVPMYDDDGTILEGMLREPPAIEAAMVLWWLLLPVLAMWAFGVRTSGEGGSPLRFGTLPGGRLVVAYAIWLFVTSVAASMVTTILGGIFSSPGRLYEFEGGAPEAFGWLFIRGAIYLALGSILTAIILAAAIVAHAAVNEVSARRGTAAPHEVAATRFLLGALVMLIFVGAYAIVLVASWDRAFRLTAGIALAFLIVGTFALLMFSGVRAARKAARTGSTDWTKGLVRTRMPLERIIISGATLVLLLAIQIYREFA